MNPRSRLLSQASAFGAAALLLALAAGAPSALRAQPAEPAPEMVLRVFRVRHADPAELAKKLAVYQSERGAIEVREAVIAVTDAERNIKRMELLVDVLDVGPELRVYEIDSLYFGSMEELRSAIEPLATPGASIEIREDRLLLEDVEEAHERAEAFLGAMPPTLVKALDGRWRLASMKGTPADEASWIDSTTRDSFSLKIGETKTFAHKSFQFTVRLAKIDPNLRLAVLETVSVARNGEEFPLRFEADSRRAAAKAVYSLLTPWPASGFAPLSIASDAAAKPVSPAPVAPSYTTIGYLAPEPPSLKEALRARWKYSYAMGPPLGDAGQGEAQWTDNANQEDFKMEPGDTKTFRHKRFEFIVKLASIDGGDYAANLETVKIVVEGHEIPPSLLRGPDQKATYSLLSPANNP